MVVVHEESKVNGKSKPIICPKCRRGKIGSIPNWVKAKTSKRGNPHPKERCEYFLVRCAVCGSLVSLTIE